MGYMSDNLHTPYGQRIPVYALGSLCVLPFFFMVFNPPEFAIGKDENNPKPWVPYFFIMPTIMNIG